MLLELWEKPHKDTVIAYPGEATRVKSRFGIPGLFVWRYDIVEHEDHQAMHPRKVGS